MVGGIVGAILGGVLGADVGQGLAPPFDKARSALEGAAFWAVGGLVLGALLGVAVGGIIRVVRDKRQKP